MADMADAKSGGIAFLVSAGIVYEIVAAACSSPQTTEINAKTRSKTLMKWVYIGLGQAAMFVLIAASTDEKHRAEILWGGIIASLLLYFEYWHANRAGLQSTDAGTEDV